MAVSSPRPDRWSRWFFRLVQVTGWGLGIHEVLGPGRATVLMFCGALILGSVGVRAMVRGVVELAQQSQPLEGEQDHRPE